MNIANQENNNNYTLSSGSDNNKDLLNYNYADYNNYQSWSNVVRGNIQMSSIDENNNVNKINSEYNRLQGLKTPFMTFVDTKFAWAQSNKHAKESNEYLYE